MEPRETARAQVGNRRAAVTFAATATIFGAALAMMVAAGEMDAGLAVFLTVELALPALGLFIVLRTNNRVGWLFLLTGFALSVQAATWAYSELAFSSRPPLPGAGFSAWISDVVWLPQLVAATLLLFLLFPDGRLPSRRWRPVVLLIVMGTTLIEATVVFEPTLYDRPGLRAPLGGLIPESLLDVMGTVGSLILLPAVFLAVSSLVVRYRRSRGVARQQVKWFAFAATAAFAAQMVFNVFEVGRETPALQLVNALSALLVPVAVAIAIVRFRLFDIDLVINRSLVYAALSLFLGAVYLGGVLVIGPVLAAGGGGNEMAVAASTLIVAALFRPARARIQDAVDRRFYRRRYDAARTLEEFVAYARREVDLRALVGHLEGTVQRTLEPAFVFVWLPGPRDGRSQMS